MILVEVGLIVKNKLTKETLVLSETEFKTRFNKELQVALDSYRKTELSRPYFRFKKDIESDFYFGLRFNFNNFSNSVWYIDKI